MPADAEDEWATLSQAVGEGLLDVQRTFLNLVDQRALGLYGRPSVPSYLVAVARLQLANVQLLRHLLEDGMDGDASEAHPH